MKKVKTILVVSIIAALIVGSGVYAGYLGYQYYQAEKKQVTELETMKTTETIEYVDNSEVIPAEETTVNEDSNENVTDETATEEAKAEEVATEIIDEGMITANQQMNHTVTFVIQNGATGVYAPMTFSIQVPDGEEIPANAIPTVPAARRGWEFLGWTSHPALHGAVTENVTFTAQFAELRHYFTFVIGEGGLHEGTVSFYVRDGHFVFGAVPRYFDIPALTTPLPGWEFVGWTPNTPVFEELVGRDVTEGMTFVAVFRFICEDCNQYPCECIEPCDGCGEYPCVCVEPCDGCGEYPCLCVEPCDGCDEYPCVYLGSNGNDENNNGNNQNPEGQPEPDRDDQINENHNTANNQTNPNRETNSSSVGANSPQTGDRLENMARTVGLLVVSLFLILGIVKARRLEKKSSKDTDEVE